MKTLHALAFLLVVTGTFATYAPRAHAEGCDAETNKKAQYTAGMMDNRWRAKDWTATNAHYEILVAMPCPVTLMDHTKAAEAAKFLGDIYSALKRYELGRQDAIVNRLKAYYGEVRLFDFRTLPAEGRKLTRTGGAALGDDGVAAVARATMAMGGAGKFRGYLPPGTYTLGAKAFTVVSAAPLLEIKP